MTKYFSALLGLAFILPTALHAQEAKPAAPAAAQAAPEAAATAAPAATPAAAPESKPAEAEKQAVEAKPAARKKSRAGEPLQLVKTPEPVKPVNRAEALKRANAFFNTSPVMTADFVQIGADGKRSEGKLHVQRAGRVRFEYAQPATMEVVADGVQVAVRDRKLGTQDLYFISQTPLKFLMKEKIDLEKDVTVEDVQTDDSGVTIFIEDKATFGGTSHVRLVFDPKTFKLKQWQVKDPQGYETLISLFNIDQTTTPDPALFVVNK